MRALCLLGLGCLLPLGASASIGYKLRLPEKSPLILRCGEISELPEALPLSEGLRYVGGSLTWKPAAKSVELERAGVKVSLLIEERWAYSGSQRIALNAPLRWKDGRLWLAKDAWVSVLKVLDADMPGLESATASELSSIPDARKAPAAEPTLQPAAEPVLTSNRSLGFVVIDAGHGGYDPGAHGHGGTEEKDICLDIAQRLAHKIKVALPDVRVFLTRNTDTFISLRKRTDIANKVLSNGRPADLFISIHNNASPDSKSRGSQVFFYDSRSSDRAAEYLANQENDNANFLDFIMMDMTKSAVRDQSIMLAQQVQDELASMGVDMGLRNRKLSYAPFYVLARTKMPAILVEVAFITNPKEERLLNSVSFRDEVADGVLRGVKRYKAEISK